ncbi:MAG: WD40/YVTN/BNR-like repeat-containing protein [Actinomycetota bacterium]
MLIAATAMYATLSARRPANAVPGRAPVLSVAVAPGGLIATTATEAFFTKGDGRWAPVVSLARSRVLVAGQARRQTPGNGRESPILYVASEGELRATQDLKTFRRVSQGVKQPTAVTVLGQDEVAVAGAGGDLATSRDPSKMIMVPPGREDIVALAGRRSGSTLRLFAGGLSGGLWTTAEDARGWRELLETPIRCLALDSGDRRRLLAGTSGGVLESVNEGRTWTFTAMRVPTEAIAQGAGEWFAVGQDRLLYRSSDGRSKWEAVTNSKA